MSSKFFRIDTAEKCRSYPVCFPLKGPWLKAHQHGPLLNELPWVVAIATDGAQLVDVIKEEIGTVYYQNINAKAIKTVCFYDTSD